MQKGKSLLAKIVMFCLAVTCCFALVLGVASCGKDKDPTFAINSNGELVVTYSNGESKVLGSVKGDPGATGATGAVGEAGAAGVGVEAVEFDNNGKLVIRLTDGSETALDMPEAKDDCKHEFRPYALEEATCLEAGLNLEVCKLCGNTQLVEVKALGHQFEVVDYDENHIKLDEDGLPVLDEDGNQVKELLLTFECVRCENEAEHEDDAGKAFEVVPQDGYKVTINDATYETARMWNIDCKYEHDGKVVSYKGGKEIGPKVNPLHAKKAVLDEENEPVLDKDGNPVYEYLLDERVEYTKKQVAAALGENAVSYFGNILVDCTTHGNAYFYCEECERYVLLQVIGDHDFEVDMEATKLSAIGKEGVGNAALVLKCKDCERVENLSATYEMLRVAPTCKAAGWFRYRFTYKLNGLNDVNYSEEVPLKINPDNHKYGENIFELDKVYSMDDLREAFGEDVNEHIKANNYSCVKEGLFEFKCSACHNEFVFKFLGDHDYEQAGEPIKGKDDKYTLNFKCKVCGATYTAKVFKYESINVPATCAADGEYGYRYQLEENGAWEEKILGKFPKTDNQHRVATVDVDGKEKKLVIDIDSTIDLNDYTGYGRTLDELHIVKKAANKMDCQNAGYVEITCQDCHKTYTVKAFGLHEGELDGKPVVIKKNGEEKVQLNFKCKVCGKKMGSIIAAEYRPIDEPATCAADGRYGFEYKENEGDEEWTFVSLAERPKNASQHKPAIIGEPSVYKDNLVINEDEVYQLSWLKENFGWWSELVEDPETHELETVDHWDDAIVFAYNKATCVKSGYATIVCYDCGQEITIAYLVDHEYEVIENDARNSLGNAKDASVALKCKNCKTELFLEHVAYVDRTTATCTDKGVEYRVFSKGGKELARVYGKEADKDLSNHMIGGVVVNVDETYTEEELIELIGQEAFNAGTPSANQITCSKAGYRKFICDRCHEEVIITYFGDHDFIKKNADNEPILDDNHEVQYNLVSKVETKDGVTLVFKCNVCGKEVTYNPEFELDEKPATNINDGYLKISYRHPLTGIQEIVTLATYTAHSTVHQFNGFVIDVAQGKEFTVDSLKALFEEQLENTQYETVDEAFEAFVGALEMFDEQPNAVDTYFFECTEVEEGVACNKSILIVIKGLNLDEYNLEA